MDSQNKNLILATALSFLVILVWFILFPPPETQAVDPNAPVASNDGVTTPAAPAVPATSPAAPAQAAAEATESDAPRLAIDTPRIEGAISLLGGRIDQLALKDYREENEPGSANVTVLSPVGSENAYYALFGWAAGAGLSPDAVPGPNTLWSIENGATLTPDSPITLVWDNNAGQTFRRTISVDQNYMFSVTQSITNTGASAVSLAPYGILARHGEPANAKNFFILHEGTVGMADGELTETSYGNLEDLDFNAREGTRAEVTQVTESGWIGFTDHYWMSTLIPTAGTPFKSVIKYDEARNIFQAEAVQPTQTVAPGQTVSADTQLFSGA
jgi:YidC/Oxa1 family membrane protein insertase